MKPLPILEIIDYEIDKRMSVDINSLRGLEDPRLFDEFNKWFASKITVDRTIQQLDKFFKILLGDTSLGWLGDEVSIIKFYFLKSCVLPFILNQHASIPPQQIHEYFRLINEK